MNKFTVTEDLGDIEIDESKPVLYWVYFGDKGAYYLHKSKDFKAGYQKFLDDVFRGIRGKNYPDMYLNVVEYCKKFPAIYKVTVELELNEEPGKLLRHEARMYKHIKSDPNSLNRPELGQFKPEWMLRHVLKEKCEKCLKNGIVDGEKMSFNFCPRCGRSIKK